MEDTSNVRYLGHCKQHKTPNFSPTSKAILHDCVLIFLETKHKNYLTFCNKNTERTQIYIPRTYLYFRTFCLNVIILNNMLLAFYVHFSLS